MSFVLTSCALLLALLVGVVVDTSSHKLDLIEATPAEPDCRHFVAIRPGGLPVLLPAVRPPLSMSVQAYFRATYVSSPGFAFTPCQYLVSLNSPTDEG
jgi:hypothetical protein